MTHFEQGKTIGKFTAAQNLEIIVRYPKLSDLAQLTDYINTLSLEDTFITMSGEQYSIEQEAVFLKNMFAQIEAGDGILALAFDDQTCIGMCNIDRDFSQRTRGVHRFKMGLSLSQNYRGLGIGFKFSKITINEAQKILPNFKILTLDLFGENIAAFKTYQKLGFEEIGRLKNGFFRKGKYSDQVLMAYYL